MAELLLVGSVDNAAAPASVSSKLYGLSESYGSPVGATPYLTVQTQSLAPLGPTGIVIFRRIYVTVGHDLSAVVRVTPTVDFSTDLDPQVFTLAAGGSFRQDPLEVKLAHRGTYLSALVEVLSTTGRAQVLGIRLGFLPMGQGAATIGATE